MTAPSVFPSLDEQDRELADLCFIAAAEAAGDGDEPLAVYLRAASEWHEEQIASRGRAA